jgi:hypothetical protein
MNRRPRLQLIAPSASPEEAAAMVAALERFMRDTAPPRVAARRGMNPWRRAALLEGVGAAAAAAASWGDRHRWGS